ncbi:hypothetical protein Agub_g8901 [Astrephomene gubernaculifera]|uniref:Membrane transporter protein n=1 Tax=Astrephomene gubernaculifera TaxID=47775 RepID=A0AAD3DSS3_9CHLO|nr:hypothetical protein Agub_g8901 [Astrephomene gubernaculifera]
MTIPSPSIYVVLSLGALSGGVVKGITGFGNAIINLLVWVAFTAAGVDAGPLRLAVLADTIGCLVCGIPLLVMTAAHKTADWRLVLTFVLFTSAGSPLGALLLTRLNPRWVELVMAIVLLLVICLHVRLHETLAAAFRRHRAKRSSAPYDLLGSDHKAAEGDRSDSSNGACPEAITSGMGVKDGRSATRLDPESLQRVPTLLSGSMQLNDHQQTSARTQCLPHSGEGLPVPQSTGTAADVLPHAAPNGDSSCTAGGDDGGQSCLRSVSSGCDVAPDNTRRAGGPHGACAAALPAAPAAAELCVRDTGGLERAGKPSSPSATVILISACCSASGAAPAAGALAGIKAPVAPEDADACGKAAPHSKAHAEAKAVACSSASGNAGTQPLLDTGLLASDAVPLSSASASGSEGGGASIEGHVRHCGACSKARLGGVWGRIRGWLARQDWLQIRRILTIGSVAGFASGVMGGMTGIGGPPIMYMYEKLRVAKDVVRGTNAVNNVLQARLVTYIVMGVFKREEVPLYLITSTVGLVGVGVGNCLAGRLDQKGFSRILVALMSICCLLLFVSAAGLKG